MKDGAILESLLNEYCVTTVKRSSWPVENPFYDIRAEAECIYKALVRERAGRRATRYMPYISVGNVPE